MTDAYDFFSINSLRKGMGMESNSLKPKLLLKRTDRMFELCCKGQVLATFVKLQDVPEIWIMRNQYDITVRSFRGFNSILGHCSLWAGILGFELSCD